MVKENKENKDSKDFDSRLEGKTVLVGVSAGIAAYKTCYLVSRLVRSGADVHVIMTEKAAKFVSPLTFETLSGNRCVADMFDRNFEYDVAHVSLAKKADIFMVAPATADVIAKFAMGLADDMLTTTFLACRAKKIVVPAMNTGMYENVATQDNLEVLRKRGISVMDPASGHLACGDTGAGKMPEPEELFSVILDSLGEGDREPDLKGKTVLVTCGATRESLDPVRFITNHSTGKMGMALAAEAAARGADVVVVKAAVTVEPPEGAEVRECVSAGEMYDLVTAGAKDADIIVMAAAVADYRPKTVAGDKIKKTGEGLTLELERTRDILAGLGEMRERGELKKGVFICGFSMETKDLVKNSTAKLEKKKCDMIVANDLKEEGAGFAHDTNRVTLITKGGCDPLELMSKKDAARAIFDRILKESR